MFALGTLDPLLDLFPLDLSKKDMQFIESFTEYK
jgi:hypothetical protein